MTCCIVKRDRPYGEGPGLHGISNLNLANRGAFTQRQSRPIARRGKTVHWIAGATVENRSELMFDHGAHVGALVCPFGSVTAREQNALYDAALWSLETQASRPCVLAARHLIT